MTEYWISNRLEPPKCLIDLHTTIVRSASVLTSPIENSLAMMDIESGHYFSLDDIGNAIWERMAEPIQVGDLCARLVETFEVLPEICQHDVLALLNEMAKDKLILRCD
jgi:hypothetical protein